jgi:hypothetical protein
MAALMVMDHLYFYIYPQSLLPWHYISRTVAPTFAFFAAEALYYTRSREKYILRLCGFGALTLVGSLILDGFLGAGVYFNILFALALGSAVVYCLDLARSGERPLLYLSFAILLFALSPLVEGRFMIPVSIMIFFFLRDNKPLMYMCYILFAPLPYLLIYFRTGEIWPQFYMFTAVLPIMLYNGERGPGNKFAKYFFYLFYPVHIWIIMILSVLL